MRVPLRLSLLVALSLSVAVGAPDPARGGNGAQKGSRVGKKRSAPKAKIRQVKRLRAPRRKSLRKRPKPGVQRQRFRRRRAQRQAAQARLRGPRYTRGNPLKLLPKRGAELKVGVFGRAVSEADVAPELKARLVALGEEVARRGGVVITGAAPGVPHITARAAHRKGAFTIGVSAAGSEGEHVVDYKAPHDSLDIIQLAGTGPRLLGFIEREAPLLQHTDIAVYAHGATGTLGELVAAMHERKVIALLEDSGGLGGHAREKVLPHIGTGKAVVVHDRDPRRLMEKAVRAHEKLQRERPERRNRPRIARSERRAARDAARERAPRRRSALDAKRAERRDVYAFLGTGEGLPPADRRRVDRLADLVAKRGRRPRTLVTPTRRGLTSWFVRRVRRKSRESGAEVETLGVSSAGSAAEHGELGKPADGYSSIFHTGKGGGIGQFAAQRSIVEHANVVFVAGGDYKTLSGVIHALYAPTVVAVLKGKGLSGKLKREILDPLKKKPHAKVIYDTNPDRLYQRAVSAAEKLRSEERSDLITAAE